MKSICMGFLFYLFMRFPSLFDTCRGPSFPYLLSFFLNTGFLLYLSLDADINPKPASFDSLNNLHVLKTSYSHACRCLWLSLTASLISASSPFTLTSSLHNAPNSVLISPSVLITWSRTSRKTSRQMFTPFLWLIIC